MPLFPEHAPRRRLLDVSELLGEQVVRLDKAQGNVTPDEYRRYQEERMAKSKAFAEQQSKLHPAKPPAPKPPEPGFWETYAKVPSKLADVIEHKVLPSSIASPARKVAEAISPIDISPSATMGSQAVGTIATLAGARILTALNNLRKLKGTAKASHDVARDLTKARAAGKAESDALRARSQQHLAESSRIFSGNAAGGAAGGIAESVAAPVARKSFIGGVGSGIADKFRQTVGFWPKGLPTNAGIFGGLGYLAGTANIGSLWQKGGSALGVADAALNRPPDLPFAVPNEAPGPASPPAKVKPADVKEEIRAADREWIDPRHGGARGVNEQGFAEKILQRPSNRDLAGIRGSAAEESVRSNAGFAEARSAYMRLKNKVRILNERGIPLGSGLTPFELEDWNTFNSPDLRTSSGLSIYDPEAARNAK